MRCSRLILIYGIFYLFSCILIMRENMILDAVKTESERIEYAFKTAADAAVLTLKESIYEDGAENIAKITFEYIFKTAYDFSLPADQSETIISEITLADEYGKRVTGSRLKSLTEGEEIKICFILKDIPYNAYGRHVIFKKTREYTITLD